MIWHVFVSMMMKHQFLRVSSIFLQTNPCWTPTLQAPAGYHEEVFTFINIYICVRVCSYIYSIHIVICSFIYIYLYIYIYPYLYLSMYLHTHMPTVRSEVADGPRTGGACRWTVIYRPLPLVICKGIYHISGV